MWLPLFAAFLMTAYLPGTASGQEVVRRTDAQFVASSRGEVYYWIGCDGWKRLSPRNLRFYHTASDAEKAGYRPSQARGCAPQLDTALIEPKVGGTAECIVARIIDGDTFVCEGGTRIRLLLVDAPETGQGEWADSAAAVLRRFIPPGSRAQLSFDVELFDRYDRVLAYVHAGDTFVNRELARRGLGHVAVYPPNVHHVDLIRAAADSARAEKRGLWASSAFECTPVDFRRRRCER